MDRMALRKQNQLHLEAPPQLRLTPAPMGPQPQVIQSVAFGNGGPERTSKREKLAEIGAWVGSWFWLEEEPEEPKINKADIGQPTGFMHVSGNELITSKNHYTVMDKSCFTSFSVKLLTNL